MHMVMRHGQARLVNLQGTKQQNIQIECAWPPALGLAGTTLLLFDSSISVAVDRYVGWMTKTISVVSKAIAIARPSALHLCLEMLRRQKRN